MQIWAHTLVKNEDRFLWYSIKSIVNHVDRVLLWDTGSTDKTKQIIQSLVKDHPDKIHPKMLKGITAEEFPKVRQEMLNKTTSDWFIVVDGDEIWWDESIKKVLTTIREKGKSLESIVVPSINVVGDIFHYQDQTAGRYNLAGKTGHYALRAVNRSIPGLSSRNPHGTWGWVDGEGRMIQDRAQSKIGFVDAPYLHTTFLKRSSSDEANEQVPKRKRKFKVELGKRFPDTFKYPEVFYLERPPIVASPWGRANLSYLAKAIVITPFKVVKRRLIHGKTGY